MKIQISKRFVKDVKKIADKRILLKIKQIIERAGEVEDLSQLTGIEEMWHWAISIHLDRQDQNYLFKINK